MKQKPVGLGSIRARLNAQVVLTANITKLLTGLNAVDSAGLYNTGNLQKYYAALDKLEDADAIHNVVVLGDSDSEGYLAGTTGNDWLNNGYVGLINLAYAQKYDDTGIGFIPVFAPYNSTVKWTFDENWANYTSLAIGITAENRAAQTAGAVATFNFSGTGVKVLVATGSLCGDFTAKIDGVNKGTFTTTDATDLIYTALLEIATAGSLADGAHVLEITTVDATLVILEGAVELTNATKGIRIIRNCRYNTKVNHAVGAEYIEKPEIDIWNPILTIIAYIANDITGTTNTTTYQNDLETLATRAKLFGDVIMYANYSVAVAGSASPYVAAMHAAADATNSVFIDAVSQYEGKLTDLGYYASDNIHANAACQRRQFKIIGQVL